MWLWLLVAALWLTVMVHDAVFAREDSRVLWSCASDGDGRCPMDGDQEGPAMVIVTPSRILEWGR